ncbi:N-methyl-L-tryptophan oxidase [Paenibacillus protaetiae]|uniref:N-methyl-L-tryptophan oxidase n=1 Tax=Paenibacillus protaetiae TaxID=2509456 RepID=A0A4V0YF34_9BACL|nr:N-methyl-L-tryptophan oxidase [Paenibacillus protaetiae]QAY66321.1 N-methyl-L-tryptophan oxidase [Paenibacillus protaetiae]
MHTSYDVIVVGAGSMGMSAGYYLARQGVRVLLIDAFDPPHLFGSHHGDTRLMRHVYSGSPVYTEMALRADRLWTELEQESGETLLVRSGVLNAAPAASVLSSKINRSAQYHVPVELLDADEIRTRWSGFQFPDGFQGLYEQQAGYLLCDVCVRTYRRQAESYGAEMLVNTPVEGIEAAGEGFGVRTRHGLYTADKLVLSLGAWFGSIRSFIDMPVRPVRKVVGWFQSDNLLFDTAHFPGFTFGDASGGYYGFPSRDGSGVKIGRHDAGRSWRPGEPFEPFGAYEDDERDLRRALEAYMPRAAGKLLRGGICKYEMTPDEDFIIDTHPEHRNVLVAGGFSGHGFKFSSVVGEIISDLVIRNQSAFDLAPFHLSRFNSVTEAEV